MSRSLSAPAEPLPDRLRNPLKRYLLATRPAFLTITLAGCLLGMAGAWSSGTHFDAAAALVTLALAMLVHAGVNVLNDYYDHLNGSDALNADRLFPYTGGSRFIQNGVLSPQQTLAYGLALFAVVIVGGLWLMAHSGGGLFWIGLGGLAIGWAYSAPPLRLNSRGLGEAGVVAGFLLLVVGADYVQRGSFATLPWVVGLPYALLTANILYINQFPDRQADLLAGKRHWVARLAPAQAAVGYALILAAAGAWLVGSVLLGGLPAWSLASLAGLAPGLKAARELRAFADQPQRLRPAIRATLAAAHLHALLLAALLFAMGRHSL